LLANAERDLFKISDSIQLNFLVVPPQDPTASITIKPGFGLDTFSDTSSGPIFASMTDTNGTAAANN
jgi:hypothetical protein